MSSAFLSIVTPTLNSAATIRSTLESLRPLIDAGAQHIIVDSGSVDGTLEIARDFGSEVLYHPPGNMYSAINAGMAKAQGDWLTYINGDDILFSDSTREALDTATENATVIYGDIDFIDDQGRFLFSRRSPEPRYFPWLMRHYNPCPQQGTLFRRDVFEKAEGFSQAFRFAADLDFFMRCVIAGERFWKFRGKSVAAFRLSASQLSQTFREEMAAEGIRIRARLCEEARGIPDWVGRPLSSVYRRATNVDGIFLRWQRGRGQDAAWRS